MGALATVYAAQVLLACCSIIMSNDKRGPHQLTPTDTTETPVGHPSVRSSSRSAGHVRAGAGHAAAALLHVPLPPQRVAALERRSLGGGRGGHMRRLEEDLRGRLTRHGPFRSMAEPVPCDRMREDCAITQTAVSAQDSRPTPDPPCTLGFKAQCGAALPAAPHPAAHWLRP